MSNPGPVAQRCWPGPTGESFGDFKLVCQCCQWQLALAEALTATGSGCTSKGQADSEPEPDSESQSDHWHVFTGKFRRVPGHCSGRAAGPGTLTLGLRLVLLVE